jgi:hypothetical protein
MTAKEYLERLGTLSKRIDAHIREKEQLMAMATRATTAISGMPKGSDSKNTFEKFMDKIMDMEMGIVAEIDRLADEKAKTREMIDMLASEHYRDVLKWKYVEMHSTQRIALMIPCDRTTVWRVEKEALSELNKIMRYYGILQHLQH